MGRYLRPPRFAGLFYPESEGALRALIEGLFRAAAPPPLQNVVGGLLPHAGYVYSGPTAAAFFRAVAEPPQTVVFCASVHVPGVRSPSVGARGAWSTPLGDVPIDEPLAEEILSQAGGIAVLDATAHEEDHAIEVELPFLAMRWPGAGFVPIATPPTDAALPLGEAIARAIRALGRRALVVASSDLTHYGAAYGYEPYGSGADAFRRAHRENDGRLLRLLESLDGEGVLADALLHRSACGGGALAAACAAAKGLGGRTALILRQTSSFERDGGRAKEASVGYAAAAMIAGNTFTIVS